MEFLNEMFGSSIQKTRDQKRKFAAKEYFDEINGYTQLLDLRNGIMEDLESMIEKYGIIEVQLLDFAGSIFLDKAGKIKSGLNRLFHADEKTKESDLLHHKIKLVRFMRKFKHQAAMNEYEQIMKYEEVNNNKFSELRYSGLKARILMRMRKLMEAKNEFERAFTLLETKFSEKEKRQLNLQRDSRNKSSFGESNWDSLIIDYDETWLKYLYCATLFMTDNYFDPPILPILFEVEELATINQTPQVLMEVLQLRAEVQIRMTKFNDAERDIKNALIIAGQYKLHQSEFEIYSDLVKSLITTYCITSQFGVAESELMRFFELVNDDQDKSKFGMYLVMNIEFNSYKGDIQESFQNLKLLTKLYKEVPAINIFEPLFISKHIFQYIIQGIFLNELIDNDEINVLIDQINKITETTELANIYSTLIKIHCELLSSSKTDIIDEYENSKNQIDELLGNVSKYETRYYLIIVHYFYLTILHIDKVDYAISDLKNVLEKFYETMISSPHVILAVKVEVMRKTLQNELEDLPNLFNSIMKKYQTPIIEKLIHQIEVEISDSMEYQEFFVNLLKDEIYLLRYENIKPLPLIEYIE